MLKFLLFSCFLVPVSAALPIVSMAQGKELYDSETEELLATFSLVGDSTKTPFILRIIFDSCNELKGTYGEMLSLTDFKLKYYKNELQAWETIDLEFGRNLRVGKNLRQNKNSRANKSFIQNKNFKTDKNTRKGKRMQNCIYNIEFYEDIQEKYDMEIYASWNKLAIAGTYYGNAYINILPKP